MGLIIGFMMVYAPDSGGFQASNISECNWEALVTGAALKSCHAWINATPQAYAAHAARVTQTVEKGRSVHGNLD